MINAKCAAMRQTEKVIDAKCAEMCLSKNLRKSEIHINAVFIEKIDKCKMPSNAPVGKLVKW